MHSHQLNSDRVLQLKLERACTFLEISCPQTIHFENEAYHSYLNFLQELLGTREGLCEELEVEEKLMQTCKEMLRMYLECARGKNLKNYHYHEMKEEDEEEEEEEDEEEVVVVVELEGRSPLVLSVMQVLVGLESSYMRRYVPQLFPSLVDLIRVKHSSNEVQHFLSNIFNSCIGPMII